MFWVKINEQTFFKDGIFFQMWLKNLTVVFIPFDHLLVCLKYIDIYKILIYLNSLILWINQTWSLLDSYINKINIINKNWLNIRM